MSERGHYVLSNGSPTKRAVLHHLREEGGQESEKINVVGQKKMENGHYISTFSPSALPATLSNQSLTSPDFLWHLSLTHLQCRLWQHIVDQPIETYHYHLMCATCLRGCTDDDSWCCPCGDPSHQLSIESL